jgi:hypothetical protein
MALTRAQLLAGNTATGTPVLTGQVQGVKQGAGILIASNGDISVDASTTTGLMKLNNPFAYDTYVWPNVGGTAGQQLTSDGLGNLFWRDPDGIPWTQKGQLIVGTGTNADILLNAGANDYILKTNSMTPSGLEWITSIGLPVSYTQTATPTSPVDGQLWYDCNTGYFKVYQSCVAPSGWTKVSEPGLPVLVGNTGASPVFTGGSGTSAAPYTCTVTTTGPGSTVFVINTVTITGLAPNQYVPIVDLNAVTNGGRFSFSNNYANALGVLVFQTIFSDAPSSPPATSYTAAIKVGYGSVYINATVNVVAPLSTTSGSIAGNATVGATLTYTTGVASGGTGPYTYAWTWRKASDNSLLQTGGATYVLTAGEVGDRVYVALTATDVPLATATASTANYPATPTTITPVLSLSSPGSIAGTAQVGQTLTYTTGTATGGIPSYAYTWFWKRTSDNSILQTNGSTYLLTSGDAGDNVYVELTATDSATPTSATATGNTADYPTPPAIITGTVFPSLPGTLVSGPTQIPQIVSGNWADGAAPITSTGCLEISLDGATFNQGPLTPTNGSPVYMQWDPTGVGCGAAPHNTSITGTLTNGTYTENYSLTLDRNPDSFTLSPITNVALSGTATSNSITLAGTNAPAYITYAIGTPDTLTNVKVSIGGTAYVTVPTSGTTVVVNPGQTLQFQGDVGAANSTTYTATINVGTTTSLLSATTVGSAPAISTPAITSPANGTTGINPGLVIPAVATLNSSAYNAINGAGVTQTSSNWEVYANGVPSSVQSTNTITAVAAPTLVVGQSFGGGYYAGQISTAGNSVADYNLIVAPVATGQYPGGGSGGTPTTVQYKTSNTADAPSATFQNEVYGKPANDAGNDAAHPAFQWARSLNIGGFNDWYIPAKRELEILYYNLKPTTTSNNTSSGINPNAVPARASNYTTSAPGQTTVTVFKAGGSEAFSSTAYNYWSSTELLSDTRYAWAQYFGNGIQNNALKNLSYYARAIRRVAVTGLGSSQVLSIASAGSDSFAVGGYITGVGSGATGIITAISGTTVTITQTSVTDFIVGEKIQGAGTAITGSPFTVSSSPFTTLSIPKSSLAVSTLYAARVQYATSNAVATTSSFSPWSSFTTAASFVPAIGQAYGGGYFAGQIQIPGGSGTIYNLIVAPVTSGSLNGQNGGATPTVIQWKTSNTGPDTTAQSDVYGATAMLANSTATWPMFNWCKNGAIGPNAGTYDATNAAGTGIGGFNDWYIPAKNELEILYFNLKPGTTANDTSSGINPNAVPARASNYTAGTPAQTTNALFAGGAQAFSTANYYWSATEYSSSPVTAWVQTFSNGDQAQATGKANAFYARAIRRVPF